MALGGIFVLRADAQPLFERLLRPGLPFIVLSAGTGLATLLLLRRSAPGRLRLLAVVAVVSVLAGWGVAEYPLLLGTHLPIAEAAAPKATLTAVVVVVAAAVLVCVPSFALLYILQERGGLEGT